MNPIGILRSLVVSIWLVAGPIVCTAQWTTGPKVPCNDRVYFKVFSDTMFVRKDLHDTNRKRKAYGAVRAMGWRWNRSGHYPGNHLDLPRKGSATTDTAFRKGSHHLLTGTFRYYYHNGKLQSEYIFYDGYVLSEKHYRRDNGDLYMWVDFDIDFDGCLFSRFEQVCRTEGGVERSFESFFTYIDKKPGSYHPDYAWKAKRHNWQLACEIWAEPIRYTRLGSSKVKMRSTERALDVLLIRPDQYSMPAYVAVKLPRDECPGPRIRLSDLEMTITHADGRPVGRLPMLALIKPTPGNGFRTRKALFGPYFYFPLGDYTTDGFQAYDLSPGSYEMEIFAKPDTSSGPILIGIAPLEVYNDR